MDCHDLFEMRAHHFPGFPNIIGNCLAACQSEEIHLRNEVSGEEAHFLLVQKRIQRIAKGISYFI